MTQGTDRKKTATRKRPCPLCDADAPKFLFEKESFPFVRCGACGHVYVSEVPRDNVHFEDAFFANKRIRALDDHPVRAERMRRFVKALERHLGPRKDLAILDVGCGKGWNLAFLKNAGYVQTRGADINREAILTARHHGLEVDEGYLEDQKYPDGSFDAVLMDQVIEHLENPKSLLREAHRILRKGGVFWASVPNIRAWHIRLFLKQRHRHFEGSRHLNYYTPASFADLFRRTGFEPVRVGTYFEELTIQRLKGVLADPASFDVAAARKEPVAARSEADRGFAERAKRPLAKSIVAALAAPVNWPLVRLTRLLNGGAYLEIIARRSSSYSKIINI